MASVCDLAQEQVKQLLTDVFSALIEINCKTKQSIKLKIKKDFGSIVLHKNGELCFANDGLDQSYTADQDDYNSVFKMRN